MVEKLFEILQTGRIFLQTHNYPDPDAIASAFGLQKLLAHFGLKSEICYVGAAERASVNTAVREFDIDIAPYSEALGMQEDDKIVLVDGQKLNANMTDLPGDEVACIDHHPIYNVIEYQYSDIRLVGACSSIIADYYDELKLPMPSEVATMLLYGLQVDTGYMTRGVNELDLKVFPLLYRKADHNRLELLASRSLEFADLKAFGAAINNIQIYDKAGFVHIPFACPDALIAQVADFVLSLAEVDIAVISSSRQNGLKFSVRSVLPELHSGNLLAETMPPYGNGGGHASMAGGFIKRESIEKSGLSAAQFLSLMHQRLLGYIRDHLPGSEA
ncbi:MAG: DHH family phosphoesterase [Desulfovibrio sp.]|nr:DHH family phosphoesterase [Desulfovibrio sp.]